MLIVQGNHGEFLLTILIILIVLVILIILILLLLILLIILPILIIILLLILLIILPICIILLLLILRIILTILGFLRYSLYFSSFRSPRCTQVCSFFLLLCEVDRLKEAQYSEEVRQVVQLVFVGGTCEVLEIICHYITEAIKRKSPSTVSCDAFQISIRRFQGAFGSFTFSVQTVDCPVVNCQLCCAGRQVGEGGC